MVDYPEYMLFRISVVGNMAIVDLYSKAKHCCEDVIHQHPDICILLKGIRKFSDQRCKTLFVRLG